MKSKLFFLVLVFTFIFNTNILASSNNIYKDAINEYEKSKESYKFMYLFDFDGDSKNEVIVIYPDKELFIIYGKKDNSNVVYKFEETNYSLSEAFVSTSNNFVLRGMGGDGAYFYVVQIINNKLVIDSVSSVLDSETGSYYFNDVKVSEQKGEELFKKYGLADYMNSKTNKLFYSYGTIKSLNDYSKIKSKAISVIFKGKELSFDKQIINKSDRTFYPMRELFESLGASVSWDDKTKTASASLNKNKVEFTINSEKYRVNNLNKYLDKGTAPFISNDYSYIPIRFAAEALDFEVSWENDNIVIK